MAVITISRQFGAGGKTIGEMVAEKLGYIIADDQIIQMVATKAKVSPGYVKSIEREAGGTLLKFITSVGRKSFAERISGEGGYIDEEIYVDLLNAIIFQIASEGNAVILGRGGQFILRDLESACHVLIVADKADRVAFMEKRYGFSVKRATQVVEKQEKRRTNLYRKFGKEDFENPELYHLILNTSKLSLESARDHICLLTGNLRAAGD